MTSPARRASRSSSSSSGRSPEVLDQVTTPTPMRRADGGVTVRGVAKTFTGTRALAGIDLELRAGEVHALLGANGCGKSTLVKILSGYQDADPGSEVQVAGKPLTLGSPRASFGAGLRFVHQDLALVDDLSVTDNVLLTGGWPTRLGAIARRRARDEVQEALARLGADASPDALVRTLSPAARTIVAVARAVRRSPDDGDIVALVLDEPTATLPQHEVAVLAAVIREVARQGTAVMIISHHLQEALDLADVVTVLRDGRVVLTARSDDLTRDAVVAAMMGEEYIEQQRETAAEPSDRVVLECDRLGSSTFTDVSLQVRSGEIVGIAGLEGSGRDDLLPVLFGASPRYGGSVKVERVDLGSGDLRGAIDNGLAYVPADRAGLAALPELNARENLTVSSLHGLSSRGVINRSSERTATADWFARVGVRPQTAYEQRLGDFSGGNQQKIILARCLRQGPKVLLLDEPTQGIDVAAQASLHALLAEAAKRDGIGILVSSSDEEELASLCHRVLVMRHGRLVEELTGADLTPTVIAERTAHVDRQEPS